MKALLRYFYACVGHKAPTKTRRELREEWKAKRATKYSGSISGKLSETEGLSEKDAGNLANSGYQQDAQDTVTSPSDTPLDENMVGSLPSLEQQLVVNQSIARLQALVRRFLTIKKYAQLWESAVQEADDYWLQIYWEKEEERRRKLLANKARKQFTLQYVGDVVGTSVLYIMQTYEACRNIQRTWRGHYCRMRLPKKPPPPKLRPKPRVLKPRFGADVLRRVWARSEFEPTGQSYLHNTDFGYLQYNIWEHTEDPPEGSDVGLLTRKVKLPIVSSRDEFTIRHDKHAWVGLPIGFETEMDRQEREVATRSNAVKNLYFYSPYAVPLVSDEEKKAGVKSRKPTAGKGDHAKDKTGLELLESLGYDSTVEEYFRLPGMPRIGTKRYEPSTGRLIVYKGNNRWVRALTGEDVVLADKLADERLTTAQFHSVVSNPKESILTAPSLFEMKSGMISINNPSLEEKSSFSRSHKKKFDKAYTHAKGTMRHGDVDDDDDDFRIRKEDSQSDAESSTTSSVVAPATLRNKKESVSLLTGWTVLGDSYVAVQKRKGVSSAKEPASQEGIRWQQVRDGVRELSHRVAASRTLSANVLNVASKMDGISIQSSWHPPGDGIDHISANQYLNYEQLELFDEAAAVWSRSVFQPKKKILPRVVVWPKRAPEHYSFKFTWIPQPLVHNAVNNIYYEKTYRDFHKGSVELFSRYFHDEIRTKSDFSQAKVRQSSMLQLVSGGDSQGVIPTQYGVSIASKSSRSSQHPLHYFYDDGDESSLGGGSTSVDPDSTRHPLRARPVDIVVGKKELSKAEDDGATFISSMTSFDQLSGPPRKRHTMMPLSYDLEASTMIEDDEENDGGLFLTASVGNQPSATLAHTNTRVSLPPARNFEDYVRTTKPAQLVRAQSALESSTNSAVFDGKKVSRKFKYRPPLSNTIGAKITPMHPYEWH